MIRKLKAMPGRVRNAWLLLVLSCIGWPVTSLTLAKDEPQFVLGLSWFAIILTSIDIILTSKVREDNDGSS